MIKENNYHESIFSFYHIVNRECTKDWNIRGSFDCHNFMLIYEGSAFFKYDNNPGFIAKKGDLVYYPPNTNRLGYTFESDLMKCYAVNFSMDTLEGNLSLPLDIVWHIDNIYSFDSLKLLFSDLVNAWSSLDPYKEYDLKSIFLLILKTILRLQDSTNKIDNKKVNKVNTLISFMKDNISRNISIKEFSSLVQISPTYTNKIFKEITNTSVIKYFNKLKIDKAKEYLGDGYSVGDCSIKLGISDIYYFSKLFKLYEKTTPSEYKRTII